MELTTEEEDNYFRSPYMKHVFKGKTAVVTGAGSGIDRATACLFAAGGCNVALVDLSKNGLEKTLSMIRKRGCLQSRLYVTLHFEKDRPPRPRRVGAHGERRYSYKHAGVQMISINDSAEDLKKRGSNFAVNITAQMRLIRGFKDTLKRNSCGKVINIASTEGLGATIFSAVRCCETCKCWLDEGSCSRTRIPRNHSQCCLPGANPHRNDSRHRGALESDVCKANGITAEIRPRNRSSPCHSKLRASNKLFYERLHHSRRRWCMAHNAMFHDA